MSKVQIGYKGIDVEIISYTKHPAKIVWDMLKQTWIKLQGVKYDPKSPMIESMICDSLDKRLNPTVLETVMIEVVFKNISRVNLAQLTRHRGWLFNSESQMPQHVNHNVILPLNIANSKYKERALKLIKESQDLYDEMTAGNEMYETTDIPYQDARYLLMHGQTTAISASFTLPQLVGVCGQRLENNTADEINYAFRVLLRKLATEIWHDQDLDALDAHIYMTMLNRCDCFGAAQQKSFVCDEVFGNSFKRFNDANEYVTKATDNCSLDFTKSAWYHELKRMYKEEPELLLQSEGRMIESWQE